MRLNTLLFHLLRASGHFITWLFLMHYHSTSAIHSLNFTFDVSLLGFRLHFGPLLGILNTFCAYFTHHETC